MGPRIRTRSMTVVMRGRCRIFLVQSQLASFEFLRNYVTSVISPVFLKLVVLVNE